MSPRPASFELVTCGGSTVNTVLLAALAAASVACPLDPPARPDGGGLPERQAPTSALDDTYYNRVWSQVVYERDGEPHEECVPPEPTAEHSPGVERLWDVPIVGRYYYQGLESSGAYLFMGDHMLNKLDAETGELLRSTRFGLEYGMLVGPDPHFMVGLQRHEMRVWPVIVGPTGRGRKGLSHAEIVGVYKRVLEDFYDRLTTGLSSGEGLIAAVHDPIYRREAIKEKGLVTGYQEIEIDAGVEDKRLLVVEPEFARTLRVLGRDGNTLSPVLRLAWDDGNLKTMTKSPVTATGAHITIIAHVTKEELLRHLDSTEAASGFANRFLWIAARRNRLLPDGGKVPSSELNDIVQGLHEALSFAAQVEEMGRDEEASALWHRVYHDLSQGKPGLFGAVVGRAEPYVMRLACIYALMDISGAVTAKHLTAALALWEYAEHTVRYIWGDATGDQTADTILRALRAQGPMTQTAINYLFGRNVSADRIANALSLLIEANLIVAQEVETSGRPATLWSAK